MPNVEITDANFPRSQDLRTYHLGTKNGDIANRLLVVGDSSRAKMIAQNFDSPPFELRSERGFECYTGKYKGVPVTIFAIGMGFSAMDFLVREARACIKGDMVIIRMGSCGSLDPNVGVGSTVTPYAACAITSNYDYFTRDDNANDNNNDDNNDNGNKIDEPYFISKPVKSDIELHDALYNNMNKLYQSSNSNDGVCLGDTINASADSFYSSQGRIDPSFLDSNESLLQSIAEKVPGVTTLEMETHQLFFLAYLANKRSQFNDKNEVESFVPQGKIRAAAVHMVFAARASRAFISPAQVKQLQSWVGRAALDTLVEFDIPKDKLQPEYEANVWSRM